MKLVSMYCMLGSELASAESLTDHQERTADLTVPFHWDLERGNWRMEAGSGRPYCWDRTLTWENQDPLMLCKRAWMPCL